MYRFAHSVIVLSVALLLAMPALAAPASPPAAKSATPTAAKVTPTKAAPAAPIARVVEYTELENHVGDTIIIETTLDTVRRGTLVRYTNPGLTLRLGPDDGSIELEIPHDNVRNVSVVTDDAAAADKGGQGSDSAKKN